MKYPFPTTLPRVAVDEATGVAMSSSANPGEDKTTSRGGLDGALEGDSKEGVAVGCKGQGEEGRWRGGDAGNEEEEGGGFQEQTRGTPKGQETRI